MPESLCDIIEGYKGLGSHLLANRAVTAIKKCLYSLVNMSFKLERQAQKTVPINSKLDIWCSNFKESEPGTDENQQVNTAHLRA